MDTPPPPSRSRDGATHDPLHCGSGPKRSQGEQLGQARVAFSCEEQALANRSFLGKKGCVDWLFPLQRKKKPMDAEQHMLLLREAERNDADDDTSRNYVSVGRTLVRGLFIRCAMPL